MNHSITIGGLLLSLCILGGLGCVAFGLLMTFAAGKSDATDDGTGKQGCFVFCVGVALIVGGIAELVF